MRGPEESGAYSQRWSLSSPAEGSKQRGICVFKLLENKILKVFNMFNSNTFCGCRTFAKRISWYDHWITFIQYYSRVHPHTCLTRPWKDNHNSYKFNVWNNQSVAHVSEEAAHMQSCVAIATVRLKACWPFTSVILILWSSCSANVSGAGAEQDDTWCW